MGVLSGYPSGYSFFLHMNSSSRFSPLRNLIIRHLLYAVTKHCLLNYLVSADNKGFVCAHQIPNYSHDLASHITTSSKLYLGTDLCRNENLQKHRVRCLYLAISSSWALKR